jgi:Resolvase, N terminal domain
LLKLLIELHAKGVDLFLHQQGLDTSTPSGRAMFQMLGTFAEFERAMIREPSSVLPVRRAVSLQLTNPDRPAKKPAVSGLWSGVATSMESCYVRFESLN